ncbi:hypothetical protein BKH46_07265 [Helicobacter sp. 12S02634-8]|uniref:DUF5718 family protein n=1 Tax=Helicobacter sp. 12S02634-8 TaxID=1476199 RepID=UPI000BA60813|nr:DUF5718 family protein [Helicobacter sp. 12S02634-8]PAF46534.1 hypothetical protein BKH46_07265 [Helicobacter sp. 12S02634-8]
MKDYLGLGVAGNFANHLEQAGESNDFADIVGEEKDAPKGIFPFYIPKSSTPLGRYCVDNQSIILPQDTSLWVQAEPEVALECDLEYKDGKVVSVVPHYFMAFNDASVRNDKNAKKLSAKKNFSIGSKAMGKKIAIDYFNAGGVCDDYSIASFLIINGKAEAYGEHSELVGYSYFYQKLIDWIKNKLNTQKEHQVLEDLPNVLKESGYPTKLIVAIGATRYTHLAETRFLQKGDVVAIVVYNHKKYTLSDIQKLITQDCVPAHLEGISLIKQAVK